MKRFIWVYFLIVLFTEAVLSQPTTATDRRNPLVPGYFADPTIKKFGDTYYLYCTSDGVKLASGEPTVWISKDFINWYNYNIKLALPEGLHNCWAPDVIHARDGKYYYYMGNCEMGCNIYGYVSDSPMGPFEPVNGGKAVIPAGTAKKDFPALDAQFLVDDDGSVNSYFGTWCASFGGMGFVQLDPNDMHTILKTGFIPIAQIPKAFEAAYPVKRNGKYFLMYSSGDCRLSSYAVHYSVSNEPGGPFVPGKNSPILVTNGDGTIDGPGHHSILKEGNDYYIVYHRHDNPHSTTGEFRQVCVDKLIFSDSVTIEKVVPTHTGIVLPVKNQITAPNLAYKMNVSASSCYHLISNPTPYSKTGYNYSYLPGNAVDDDNGTLWKAASSDLPQWLTVDLGHAQQVKRIMTQFEYPIYYYQYKLEVSVDGIHWNLFSDKTVNRRCGSPMIDDHDVLARYVRLTARIVEESQRSREPAVTVDFEMPDHSLRLVIENHGLSPAKNTQIEVLKDVGWLSMGKGQTGLVAAGPIREGVSYLTPGRKLKYYLGFPQWTDTPDDEMETSLRVTYEDDSGKHFEHVVDFDFGQMRDVLFESYKDSNLAVAEAIREAERDRQSHESFQGVFNMMTPMKACVACGEAIPAGAKKCSHCLEFQPEDEPTSTST